MLSRILFTILLSTSIVQVQSAEFDPSVSEVSTHHKSREQMTRDIYDVLFKETTTKANPVSWKDIKNPEEFENTIKQIAKDKILSRLVEANWHGYQKAFEEFSNDEISELHAIVSDKAFQDFHASLNSRDAHVYAQAIREAMATRHTSTILPPTSTYKVLTSHFEEFQHAFKKYEMVIRIHAYQAVSESEKLEKVVSLLHDGTAPDLKEQLKGHMPTVADDTLDDLITAVQAKKRDLSWNNIKDELLDKHGHDLWDGTLSDTAWMQVLNGEATIKSQGFFNTFMLLMRGVSPESLITLISDFSTEQQVSLIQKAAFARHNQLIEENDEGFQRFEDFNADYGVTLSIISNTATLYNSPVFNPAKQQLIHDMDAILKDTLKEVNEGLEVEVQNAKDKQTAASEKGEVCNWCGKVHEKDEPKDEPTVGDSPQNADNSSSGEDSQTDEESEISEDEKTSEGEEEKTSEGEETSDDNSEWETGSDSKRWP